jgi:hypothetical protein
MGRHDRWERASLHPSKKVVPDYRAKLQADLERVERELAGQLNPHRVGCGCENASGLAGLSIFKPADAFVRRIGMPPGEGRWFVVTLCDRCAPKVQSDPNFVSSLVKPKIAAWYAGKKEQP